MSKIVSPDNPNYESIMDGIRNIVQGHDYKFNQYNQLIVNPLSPLDVEKARDMLEDYDGYSAEPIICINEETDTCECYGGGGECVLYSILPPDCEFKREVELIKRLKIIKDYQMEYGMTDFFADEEIIYDYTPVSKMANATVDVEWEDCNGNKHNAHEFYFNKIWLTDSEREKGTKSLFISKGGSFSMECPMFIESDEHKKWIIPKALELTPHSEQKEIPMELVVLRSKDKLLAVIYRHKRKRYWIKKEIMENLVGPEK